MGKDTQLAESFLRPIFRIVILYVDEPTSVSRQLGRALEVEAHNARVRETGVGELLEVRPTDKDQSLARRRYKMFSEQTYEGIKSLSTHFIYNVINAAGPVTEVKRH